MELFYALLGEGHSAVSSISVRGDESLAYVVKEIAAQVQVVRHLDIRVYLAKQQGDLNGPWLEEGSEELDALFKLDMGSVMKSPYLRRDVQLKATAKVSTYFPGTSTASGQQRHAVQLLVVAQPRAPRLMGNSTVGIARSSEQAQLVDTNTCAVKRRVFRINWQQDDTPCPQLVFDKSHEILHVPAHYVANSGIVSPQKDSDLLLFRRVALEDQWKQIQSESIDSSARLWIVGAPGAGKSCAAYAFACGMVDRTQWDVLWIHYSRGGPSIRVVQFQDDVKSTSAIQLTNLREQTMVAIELDALLHDENRKKKTIVFFDGYDQQDACETIRKALLHWQVGNPTKRRLVCMASMVSVPKIDGGSAASPAAPRSNPLPACLMPEPPRVMKFHLASWTLEEYLDAIYHDEFFHHVQHHLDWTSADQMERRTRSQQPLREERVSDKYFVAGGSARFMFTMPRQACIKALDEAIGRVGNIKSLLMGHVGTSSPDAVNTLLAHYLNPNTKQIEHRISSDYVVRSLASRLGPDFILQCARVLNANPAMDGHVLEAWLFASIMHGDLDYRPQDRATGEPQRWKRQYVSLFDPDSDGAAVAATLVVPGWHTPKKWNQGGYDAVFVEGPATQRRVCFVQITRALRHSFKADPFVALLRKLKEGKMKIASVTLVYAVPMQRLEDFRPPVCDEDFAAKVIELALPRTRNRRTSHVQVVGVPYPMSEVANWRGTSAVLPADWLTTRKADKGPSLYRQPIRQTTKRTKKHRPPAST